MNDALTSNLQGKKEVGDESEKDKNENAYGSVSCVEGEGKIQTSSHISPNNSREI